jgi:hypothetical protein
MAPDCLEGAPKTQAWLALSNDPGALVSGKYFYHQKQRNCHPSAAYTTLQDQFLEECARLSGISLPGKDAPGL